LEAAYQFGLNAGIAGQITDDCLDLKRGDLTKRKLTLPVIYALSNGRHPSYPRLSDLIESDDKETQIETWVTDVYGVLEEMGAVAWSLKAANAYKRRALAALEVFPKERAAPLVEYVTGKPGITT
jgi:geranylgeranyl pyrophosphate synthase